MDRIIQLHPIHNTRLRRKFSVRFDLGGISFVNRILYLQLGMQLGIPYTQLKSTGIKREAKDLRIN